MSSGEKASRRVRRCSPLLCVALWFLLASPTVAAETCTPVTSVPQNLQNGAYCLTADVGVGGQTAFTVGPNATLDCRGHSITDMGSTWEGIRLTGENATVKNCVVHGFRSGIVAFKATNYRLIGNRIEGAAYTVRGIEVVSSGEGRIAGNRVGNAQPLAHHYWAIYSNGGTADVLDNVISGAVAVPGSGASMYGISLRNVAGSLVAGNTVRNVSPDAGHQGISIAVMYGHAVLRDNIVVNTLHGDMAYFCYQGQFVRRGGMTLGVSEPYRCDM